MRGRPFQPGNTLGRGRPKGSRNKSTKAMCELLNRYSDAILGKCIRMALEGEPIAMRLCMERVFPARRDGFVQLPLLRGQSLTEIANSSARVLRAIGRGEIAPQEGESIFKVLDGQRQVIESQQWETRIVDLEARTANNDQRESIQ